MSCPDRLLQWQQEVSRAFAHLSKPQVWGLVLWSAGIALTGTAGMVQVSALLAFILQQQEQSVFQRLREWYLDAAHKSGSKQGKKRRDLDVTTCFAPLLRWIVQRWEPGNQQVVLVLDATSLREQWTVLAISVVLRGCAIPVAWKVVTGHQKGSWRPHWEGLLHHLQGSLPTDWQVVVMADRGLYARWLFEAISGCGWHPFLRLNVGIKARAIGQDRFDWVSQWIPQPGTQWKGVVDCFAQKASRVRGTLLMQWEEGYEHPWIILTDLSAQEAQVRWYGMRTWVETGFKDFKRGLWGWHHSKMRDASQVERLWLAMAVAQVWCVSLGCQAEAQQEELWRQHEPGASLPAQHCARQRRQRPHGQHPARRLSCVVRGRLVLLSLLFGGHSLPIGCLHAQPWPQTMTAPQKQKASTVAKKKKQKERERRKRHNRRDRERTRAAA